jgi:putative addiction module CopG family antidote
MPVKQIDLTAKQARFISSEIKSGRYRDESEVLQAGLELLARKKRSESKRQTLRELIQPAMDELDAGLGVKLNSRAELTAFIKQVASQAKREVERKTKKA